jgi:hypothetical protein
MRRHQVLGQSPEVRGSAEMKRDSESFRGS